MTQDFSILAFLEKIRDGIEPSSEEINSWVTRLKEFPPEQIAAFLAHAFHRPLSTKSMTDLTLAMRDSGSKLNWSHINKRVVDKHSTGGVGDKITIVLAPILAALDFAVPTIMGRALGFTGGTVDKLESIPGLKLEWSARDIESFVQKNNFVFAAQSADIAPADKIFYAMRSITGTVPSIPLITASILSKKLAASPEVLLLDVKWGSGAFMRELSQSVALAKSLVATAKLAGVNCQAFVTSMNQPLGAWSGNACEVAESARILRCEPLHPAEEETKFLTLELAAQILKMSDDRLSHESALAQAREALSSGRAYECFLKTVGAQGGNFPEFEASYAKNLSECDTIKILAPDDGYLKFSETRALGDALVLAGAGRQTLTDIIHPAVSLYHPVKSGAAVKRGDPILTLHFKKSNSSEALIEKYLETSFKIVATAPIIHPLIQEKII